MIFFSYSTDANSKIVHMCFINSHDTRTPMAISYVLKYLYLSSHFSGSGERSWELFLKY